MYIIIITIIFTKAIIINFIFLHSLHNFHHHHQHNISNIRTRLPGFSSVPVNIMIIISAINIISISNIKKSSIIPDSSSLLVNYVNSNILIMIAAISTISTISINNIRTLMYT